MQIEAIVIIGAFLLVVGVLVYRKKNPKGGRAPSPDEGTVKKRK